jgi:hypothetical protein
MELNILRPCSAGVNLDAETATGQRLPPHPNPRNEPNPIFEHSQTVPLPVLNQPPSPVKIIATPVCKLLKALGLLPRGWAIFPRLGWIRGAQLVVF